MVGGIERYERWKRRSVKEPRYDVSNRVCSIEYSFTSPSYNTILLMLAPHLVSPSIQRQITSTCTNLGHFDGLEEQDLGVQVE